MPDAITLDEVKARAQVGATFEVLAHTYFPERAGERRKVIAVGPEPRHRRAERRRRRNMVLARRSAIPRHRCRDFRIRLHGPGGGHRHKQDAHSARPDLY